MENEATKIEKAVPLPVKAPQRRRNEYLTYRADCRIGNDSGILMRTGPVLAFMALFVIVLSLAVPASGAFLQDGTGLVSMEAEHYQVNVPLGSHSWDPVTNAGYSGSGALQALPSDSLPQLSAGAGPRMDYQVQFTRTGTHYVWIRALGYSGSSDSLYVGLDGGTAAAPAVTGLKLDGTTWKWSKKTQSGGIATVNVTSAGLHTINVWMRESGTVLDKLVLTPSSSYTPTGTGPAETVGTIVDLPPTVTTNAATSITTTGATVNGGVNPNGLATIAWFEWGSDPTLSTISSTSSQSLGSGTSSQPVNAALLGLSPGAPYYFRVAASNAMGTSKGAITSFSTSSGAASGAFLQDGTGLVSMEAEHYQVNVPLGSHSWDPVTNAGYSGSGALQALPSDSLPQVSAGAGPRMDYRVQFTRTGTHYVWIRALGYSGSSDSLYVGLDGGTAGAAAVTGLNLNGTTWKWSKKTQSGGVATVNVTSPGLHTINVWMRESGIVLDKLLLTNSSGYTPTGTGPPETVDGEYVAVGDSITFGSNDTISADGYGYEPILGNLLTASKGYPVYVANEGVGGAKSADGVASIISTLSKYPSAKYYLIMYGSNDAYNANHPALPSGKNLLPGNPGYAGSFKDNMQRIISAILNAGKTPYLAEVPYATKANYDTSMIYDYNVAIDELVLTNNISVVPPPLYAYFLAHPGELDDGLHPNGTGYQSMADLWFDAIPK